MVWLEDSCVTRNLTRRSISCSIPIPVLVSIPSRHYMSRLLINGMCRFTFLVLQNPLASFLIQFLVSGNIVLMETCRCSIVHWNNTNNYKGICKFTVIITFCVQPIIIVCWLQPICVFISGLPTAGMFTEALILIFRLLARTFWGLPESG